MKIAIVNDMAMAVEVLRRVVNSLRGAEVAWIARDGAEALAKCGQSVPDLVLMDLIMPVMDGVEATRRIMRKHPCPILVVTATVSGNREKVYEAMGHGALDVVTTPTLGPRGQIDKAGALIRKIRQISLLTGKGEPVSKLMEETEDRAEEEALLQPPLLAIGASTGGPNAVSEVLRTLPAGFPAAVVVVQHVDEQFAAGLADWLDKNTPLPVRVARAGETPRPGTVYVAATNDHLRLSASGAFVYSAEPKDMAYRPSVDVFFHSVARHWKQPVLGVLLTGMGRDGAEGLLELRQAGHATIAQDEASSVVYGMPKAAAQIDAAVDILPVEEIASAVRRKFPLRR